MLRIYPALFFCLLATFGISQDNSDCETAIFLCGGLYSEDQASLSSGNTYEWTGACNNGLETASMWYTFSVAEAGNLSFILDPNNPNDDYDWGLFNITQGGCAGITLQDGSSPEVSCNSWGTLSPPNGATGISTAEGGISNSGGPGDLNGPPFNADLPVQAGEVYALVVMNWSNSFDGYALDFTSSTANIYDDQFPAITSVTHNCANTEFTITFSESIIGNSVQPTDMVLVGPGGTYTAASINPQTAGANSDDVWILTLNESVLVGGTYTVTITDVDGFVLDYCNNPAIEGFEIELSAPVTWENEIVTACNGVGGSIELSNVQGGTDPVSFLLNGAIQPDLTFDDLDDGTYTILAIDGNACNYSQTVVVPNHLISVSIPEQDSLTCLNASVEIIGVNVSPAQDVSYEWTLINSTGAITEGASTESPTVVEPGVYTVIVTDNEFGCVASNSVEVSAGEVYGVDISKLVIPNIVTPNSDGKNDIWYPYLANNPELDLGTIFDAYDLKIFDRWGIMIYETSGTRVEWKVSDQSDGVYYYTLHYEVTCGGSVNENVEGTITILR